MFGKKRERKRAKNQFCHKHSSFSYILPIQKQPKLKTLFTKMYFFLIYVICHSASFFLCCKHTHTHTQILRGNRSVVNSLAPTDCILSQIYSNILLFNWCLFFRLQLEAGCKPHYSPCDWWLPLVLPAGGRRHQLRNACVTFYMSDLSFELQDKIVGGCQESDPLVKNKTN